MRKIISIFFVVLFFNPSIYSQDFDMSKIKSNTKEVKKKQKEKRKKKKHSGFIVSVETWLF